MSFLKYIDENTFKIYLIIIIIIIIIMYISPRKLIQEPQMRSRSSHLSNKNVLSSFRNESKLKDGSW